MLSIDAAIVYMLAIPHAVAVEHIYDAAEDSTITTDPDK